MYLCDYRHEDFHHYCSYCQVVALVKAPRQRRIVTHTEDIARFSLANASYIPKAILQRANAAAVLIINP